MRVLPCMAVIACVFALSGCSDSSAPAPPAASASGAIPASLFAATAPSDIQPLLKTKEKAQAGDRVVFEARVGGRVKPFIENRAVFFVTDSSVPSCDELHGDACKTPWDYCCEPREDLLRAMATVQVVDGDGQPLKASIAEGHGLTPLRTVVVTGTVDHVDEVGNFVVNAESIHLKEG
ncbi:MAG: hypothetical protein GY715_09855 [Planctomycetes bacterium]|nr:hypothetical protein [Planctomycetota bacterium]